VELCPDAPGTMISNPVFGTGGHRSPIVSGRTLRKSTSGAQRAGRTDKRELIGKLCGFSYGFGCAHQLLLALTVLMLGSTNRLVRKPAKLPPSDAGSNGTIKLLIQCFQSDVQF
jgi:hypothetical protein